MLILTPIYYHQCTSSHNIWVRIEDWNEGKHHTKLVCNPSNQETKLCEVLQTGFKTNQWSWKLVCKTNQVRRRLKEQNRTLNFKCESHINSLSIPICVHHCGSIFVPSSIINFLDSNDWRPHMQYEWVVSHMLTPKLWDSNSDYWTLMGCLPCSHHALRSLSWCGQCLPFGNHSAFVMEVFPYFHQPPTSWPLYFFIFCWDHVWYNLKRLFQD